jgi:hypothetical protein
MRLLRALLIGVAISLLAVSVWFESGLHARFLDWTAPSVISRYPTVNINTYETQNDAEAACGKATSSDGGQ